MLDVLLERHQVVTIVVMPRACSGLGQFPPDVPLRLNLGHSLRPAMAIRTGAAGLDFSASFSGCPTAVHVPWGGLLFAGTESALRQILTGPEPAAPVREGNVTKVDFSKGRKSPGAR